MTATAITSPSDTMSEAGATTLANIIERYWARQGFTVKATVERGSVERSPQHSATIHSIRSDLINGLPRGMAGVVAR